MEIIFLYLLSSITSKNLEQFKNSKNQTIQFEQQRTINQVLQRVFQQALKEARGTLNSCLNNEVHLRTVSANVGKIRATKEKMAESFYAYASTTDGIICFFLCF